MKEFLSEYGLTLGLLGATAGLMTGKLAFGWAIGWGWVFAPLWMPFVLLLAMFAVVMGVIGMAMVAVFALVAGATYLDKDFPKAFDEFVSEEEEEVEATPETPNQESETIQ